MGTRRSVADFNEIRPDHRPDKLSPAEVYEIRDSIAGEYSYFPGRVSLILVIKADRIIPRRRRRIFNYRNSTFTIRVVVYVLLACAHDISTERYLNGRLV